MDPQLKSFNPSKQLKEEFVSNLIGSSMVEITALSTIVPALVVFRQWSDFKQRDPCFASDTASKRNNNVKVRCKDWTNYMFTLAVDFLYIILPTLSVFTVLADWTHVFAVCLILLLVLRLSTERFWSPTYHSSEGTATAYSLRTYLLSYRVSVMIVTCLCILAVDFKIFPRRYAKTEFYGTSLMDLGVGSFVLANSLVSRQARNATSLNWKAVLLSASPLLFLGFTRLAFTKGVDYQVHVGEYGVHWNFFFTLAAVAVLTSVINIHPRYCGIVGLLILIGYQICLKCGLNAYLLSNQRVNNIISQNKEGIFSVFGYWGMYLVGVNLGNHLFFGDNSTTKMSAQWARSRVWILSILFWSMTVVLDKHVESVSRRMCNLAYVSFVLAQNFQVLAILMLSDCLPSRRPLILEEAFNQNLLAAFLLANMLTGIINLYVDTLIVSPIKAFNILLGYSMVLSFFVGYAKHSGIKLKFW